jgi:hypothetical protein
MLFASFSYGQSYIFESPNTREHMSDDDAVQSLDSHEQRNFAAVARYLARKLCPTPAVMSGVGMFAGSAENTLMVSGCQGRDALYLGELLARYAHQEWVLVFTENPKESERLIVVTFTGGPVVNIPQDMRKFGLGAGTILAEGDEIRVYLRETDHSRDEAIHAFAAARRGRIREIPGKGKLIGSDSRAEAQHVFDREIAVYERRRRLKLSALLRTRRLRDMEPASPDAPKPAH